MIRKFLLVNLTFMLGLFLIPIPALAADAALFTLTITNDKPEVGKEVQVMVKGQNLQDVYAYEVNFEYDPSQLRLKNAKSAITGFSIPVIVKNNQIQFASTKIGKAAGENGNITLCTLTFEGIGKGRAVVKLTDVKLVNSSLVSVKQDAGVQVAAEIQNNGTLASPFSDIKGHWAREAIEKAAKLGFVKGYEDGTFHPQGLVTRAEFAVMLARALHLPISDNGQLSFADRNQIPSWAGPSISAAAAAGIVRGYDDHTFRPDKMISRAEITAMIVRALGIDVDMTKIATFADANQIAGWAQAVIAVAAEEGIIQGKGNNRFAPNDLATRAEAVALIILSKEKIDLPRS